MADKFKKEKKQTDYKHVEYNVWNFLRILVYLFCILSIFIIELPVC